MVALTALQQRNCSWRAEFSGSYPVNQTTLKFLSKRLKGIIFKISAKKL